jgi:hypothetical protein
VLGVIKKNWDYMAASVQLVQKLTFLIKISSDVSTETGLWHEDSLQKSCHWLSST